MLAEQRYIPEQQNESNTSLTENFLNRNDIENALKEGRIVELTAIEDKFPGEIPEHLNEVDWALLQCGGETKPSHRCKVLDVVIESENGTIEAIFKPFSGEDREAKNIVGVSESFVCEVAAYLIDKALNLGLVPPTVIKEIDGEIGSLQLFIDPKIAKYHGLDFEHIDLFSETKEWQYLAAFDYLIANPDRSKRNGFNILFSNNLEKPHIFAIDHGLCFSHAETIHPEMAKGPRGQLAITTNGNARILANRPLPPEFLHRLRALVGNPQVLDDQLKAIGLGDDKINTFWRRAHKMAEMGIFL